MKLISAIERGMNRTNELESLMERNWRPQWTQMERSPIPCPLYTPELTSKDDSMTMEIIQSPLTSSFVQCKGLRPSAKRFIFMSERKSSPHYFHSL